MNSIFRRYSIFRKPRRRGAEIAPDEIFADSRNSPGFDADQFEGRLSKPISRRSLIGLFIACSAIIAVFAVRALFLQGMQGSAYAAEAESNTLHSTPLFAARGVIYDRNGVPLAWNAPDPGGTDVPRRVYATSTGLAHVLGYVQYPSKDSAGFYYKEDFSGEDGAEEYFDGVLQGMNGLRLVEVDARGKVQSENLVRPASPGSSVTLSIDSRLQSALYESIRNVGEAHGFNGGSGIVMDVRTGEVVAMTSWPEYAPQVMTDKTDNAKIRSYLSNLQNPFIDRAVNGLYAPGSTVKPYVALGALQEGVIDPATKILSTGSISIPNPYDASKPSVFKDWRAQGWVDMRQALAVSSDVYFYEVGGGFQSQKGLGIAKLEQYFGDFGFGQALTNSFFAGASGIIPSPAWKAATFGADPWRIGDTYHTAIGQYGFQVSPVQMVRAVAALANGGQLLEPLIIKSPAPTVDRTIDLPASDFQIVREGLRQGVTDPLGTDGALNVPYVKVAAKSGTAELGVSKQTVNSWMTGFFPYDDPRYAFAVVMERGPVHNLIGAAAVTRGLFDWTERNEPEYFK